MTLGLIFLMAVVSVVSFLVVLTRIIGWRKVLKHATAVDVIFTVMSCFVLAGSITGMVIAILAGLILTGVLTVGRGLLRGADAAQEVVARRAKPVRPAGPLARRTAYADPRQDPAMPHVDFGP